MNEAGFFIGSFNMLWVAALAIGVVVVDGFMMLARHKKHEPVPVSYKAVHIVATAIGAAIALIAALMGDLHIWVNIVLAVIIVALGLLMAFRMVKKETAKRVLNAHIAIAIVCYTLFLYYIFVV